MAMIRRFVNIVAEKYRDSVPSLLRLEVSKHPPIIESRRFVNLVAEKYRDGVHSLHRLDVSKHLFYPSTPQEHHPPIIESLQELPEPCVRIQPEANAATPVTWSMLDFFGHVSSRKNKDDEGRIIFANKAGQTLLVDADANLIKRMPSLKDDKGLEPILVSLAPSDAQDQLYIMSRRVTRPLPGISSCFDVLKLGVSGDESERWLPLQPPPFVDDPRYDDRYDPAIVCSHAVVDGGRTLCVSFDEGFVGTYCFDTAQCSWRHVGDWSLPFDGCVEYVPQLKLWLGISRESPQDLCWTSDLCGMPMEQPPEFTQHVWRDDSVTPENWSPVMSSILVNLGSGRFCFTKFFEIRHSTCDPHYYGYYYPEDETEVAVLTGIEICRGEQGPKVIKHKSIKFIDDGIRWVM